VSEWKWIHHGCPHPALCTRSSTPIGYLHTDQTNLSMPSSFVTLTAKSANTVLGIILASTITPSHNRPGDYASSQLSVE
jgi:hypothetical protein